MIEDIYTKILERQEKMNEKYAPLKEVIVKTSDGQDWKFRQTNDIGIPYFSKIQGSIIQKTQFVLAGYDREWADNKLEDIKKQGD